MSKLSKIKAGKLNYKVIDFPGTTEKVAIAILSSTEITEAKLIADEFIEKHKIEKDDPYYDLSLQKQIVYRALRDKDNIKEKLADNFEDFEGSLDAQEISYLMIQYNMLNQEASPFLASLSEEAFEELKKTLEKIQWRDLNGQSLVALRNFLLSLV